MHVRTIVLAIVATSGCSAQPDDVFFIQGRTIDTTALSGVAADLTIQRTASSRPAWDACGWMSPYATLSSDESGHWTHELIRQDTLAPDGLPACFKAILEYRDGASDRAEALFIFPSTDALLPTMQRWMPHVTVEASQGVNTLHFHPLSIEQIPVDDGFRISDVPTHRAVLEVADGTVWSQDLPAGATHWSIPDVLSEDFGQVAVRIDATYEIRRMGVVGFVADATYEIRHSSAPLIMESSNVRPVSRGGRCTVDGVDLDPCVLTDGEVSPWFPAEGTAKEFEVHLQPSTMIRQVVIRGLRMSGATPTLHIESTNDQGANWTQLGTLTPPSRASSLFIPDSLRTHDLRIEFPPIESSLIRARSLDDSGISSVFQLSELSAFQ